MHSVPLQKYPAQSDGSVVRDGIRSYLKNYGLLVQRFKWSVENKNPNLPDRDLKRYIAKLVDPLAFEAGEVETVKSIEKQLEMMFDSNTDWNGNPFTIKTVIHQAGSHGWFIFQGTESQLVTFAGVGDRAGRIDGEKVTFPVTEDKNLESRIALQELDEEFNKLYANPEDGDVMSLRFEPAEDGDFTLQFEFSRD